jgi:hypothetical protein
VLRRDLEHVNDRFLRRGELPFLYENERFGVESAWVLRRDLFHGRRLGSGVLSGAFAQKMRNQGEARSELKGHCLDGCAVGLLRRRLLSLDREEIALQQKRLQMRGRGAEGALDAGKRLGEVLVRGGKTRCAEVCHDVRAVELERLFEGTLCFLRLPPGEVRHAHDGAKLGLRLRAGERLRAEALEHLVGFTHGKRDSRERYLELVGAQSELHRLVELDLRRRDIALLEQSKTEEVARFAAFRGLLQHVLQLDHRGVEIALVHVLLR